MSKEIIKRRIDSTIRGFGIYSKGFTTYGQEISVVASSSADQDCVWIQFNQQDGTYTPAHLNKENAKTIIDGLQRWLNETQDEMEDD